MWCSPEAHASGPVNKPSDIFSFGIVVSRLQKSLPSWAMGMLITSLYSAFTRCTRGSSSLSKRISWAKARMCSPMSSNVKFPISRTRKDWLDFWSISATVRGFRSLVLSRTVLIKTTRAGQSLCEKMLMQTWGILLVVWQTSIRQRGSQRTRLWNTSGSRMSELGFQNLKTSSAFASSSLYFISPHLKHWQGQHYCWSKCDQVRDLRRIYRRHDEAVALSLRKGVVIALVLLVLSQ